MTQTPPDQPLMQVPMLDLPSPQNISWDYVVQADGSRIARVFILNSHVTTLMLLDAESGMRLSAGLREIFGGIQIVNDLPGPLGLV